MPKRLSNGEKGLLGKIPILVNWVNFEAICFACAIRCACAIQYARTIDHTRQMFSNGLFVSDNFDGLYVSDLYRGGGIRSGRSRGVLIVL